MSWKKSDANDHTVWMAKPLASDSVSIFEVGARDGLQNEMQVSTAAKIALIEALADAGVNRIEAGSFVSPKWVPQMADSADILKQVRRKSGVTYSALTPNVKGFELALDAKADEVAIFGAASQIPVDFSSIIATMKIVNFFFLFS